MSKLILSAFAPSTIAKYKPAVIDFINYCDHFNLTPSSPDSFDDALLSYIDFLYETGKSRSRAEAALYGLVMYLPRLKGNLSASSLAIRGWMRLQPSKPFPPLTWNLTCLISLRLLLSNLRLCAIATLVGFHCLLRVNELVHLKVEDVADSGDHRVGALSHHMFLRLQRTKTGPNQWVSVTDTQIVSLLRSVASATSPGQFLFPFSAASFRAQFKNACGLLSLSSYVPHSLRHGGATLLALQNVPMEDILARGRWASSKSARRYIQSGRALLLSMDTPAHITSLSVAVSTHIFSFFSLRSFT